MIRVVPVDASVEKTATLLKYLQLETLGNDVPFDVGAGNWWIAYEGELPVGFGGVVQSASWGDCGYLCRSGVIRSHRGQGIQKRLLRVREGKARRLGWNWLITDTAPWNFASSNSLIATGFRLYQPAKPWGVDGALYWRKKIGKAVNEV